MRAFFSILALLVIGLSASAFTAPDASADPASEVVFNVDADSADVVAFEAPLSIFGTPSVPFAVTAVGSVDVADAVSLQAEVVARPDCYVSAGINTRYYRRIGDEYYEISPSAYRCLCQNSCIF